MKYRIVYKEGMCCDVVGSRTELLKAIKEPKKEIEDIRKIYKNSTTATVMSEYRKYIGMS